MTRSLVVPADMVDPTESFWAKQEPEDWDFAEGADAEFASTVSDATVWVAMNADGASLMEQVAAAKAAGIQRALIHLSAAGEASGDEVAAGVAAGAPACSWAATSVAKTVSMANSQERATSFEPEKHTNDDACRVVHPPDPSQLDSRHHD